jgi:hypothetical protein
MKRHYGGGDFCTYYQWGAVSCWCERSSCPDARRYWAAPLFEPKDLAFDDQAQSSIAPSEGVVAKQEPRGAVESRKDKAVKYCRRIVFDSPFTAPHIIDRHASYGQFLNRYVNVEEIVVTSKAIRETETPQAETACDPRPERWVKMLYSLGRLHVGGKGPPGKFVSLSMSHLHGISPTRTANQPTFGSQGTFGLEFPIFARVSSILAHSIGSSTML